MMQLLLRTRTWQGRVLPVVLHSICRMSDKCLQINLVRSGAATGDWRKLWLGGGIQYCCRRDALYPLSCHIRWGVNQLMGQPMEYGIWLHSALRWKETFTRAMPGSGTESINERDFGGANDPFAALACSPAES